QALEALAAVDTVVFDKTGTLTRDGLALQDMQVPAGALQPSRGEALALAVSLAAYSLHPVSRALVQAAAGAALPAGWSLHEVQEVAGAGLVAMAKAPGQATGLLRLGSALHAKLPAVSAEGLQAMLSLESNGQVVELARFAFAEE